MAGICLRLTPTPTGGTRPECSRAMSETEPSNDGGAWRKYGIGLILLGVSLMLGLLLFAFTARILTQIPDEIALHFIYQDIPYQISSPYGLFYLPLLGALIWLVNTLIGFGIARSHTFRLGAHLLWANTIAVQIILWVAALRLTGTI